MKALKYLLPILILMLTACTNQKTEKKVINPAPALSESIIGSWTTEGSSEQIDDYLTAGYGQQLIFAKDGTFKMLSLLSIAGYIPTEQTAAEVTATFRASISGKYTIAGNTLTLTYDPESVTAEMSPDDITVASAYDNDVAETDKLRQQLIERLESFGMTKETLVEVLRDSTRENGQDVFTNVRVDGDGLYTTFEGSTAKYIRD